MAFVQAHGPCALEMFSGGGAFSRSFRRAARRHGLPIFEWDIRWGAEHDLLNPRLQSLVRGWVRGGLVRLVWLGTPCTTFTSMQNMRKGGPLRSRSHPFGVPGLPAHQQAAVTAGNCLLRFSISLLSICRRMGIPCMLENPHGSGIWQNPLMVAALQWTE